MRTGTSHFVSLGAARKYYKNYVPSYTKKELALYVNNLLDNKSISIGKPEIKTGQRLIVNSEGRYEIEG